MKKNYFFLTFLPLIFFPFISFILGYLLIQWLHAPAVLSTPSLIGLTMTQAAQACQPHLALRVIQTVNNAQVPDGTILRQIPTAGQKIKTHQIISVIISVQPPPAQVPNYVDKSLEECTAHAQEQNYTLQIYPIPSTSLKNTCFAQIPEPGKSFKSTQPIILYISAPESCWWIVPHYGQHTIAQIQEYISSDVITLQIIHTQSMPASHQCNNDCRVVDQRPLPGSVIKSNTKQIVTLYVRSFDTANNLR